MLIWDLGSKYRTSKALTVRKLRRKKLDFDRTLQKLGMGSMAKQQALSTVQQAWGFK